jgi:hypothetical protein
MIHGAQLARPTEWIPVSTTVPCWTPSTIITAEEQEMLDRLGKRRRLVAFLRLPREELFDDAFHDELAKMYRDTGDGKVPVPPALVCMVLLLQAYTSASEAEAIDSMVDDRRWKLVLDMIPSIGSVTPRPSCFLPRL